MPREVKKIVVEYSAGIALGRVMRRAALLKSVEFYIYLWNFGLRLKEEYSR